MKRFLITIALLLTSLAAASYTAAEQQELRVIPSSRTAEEAQQMSIGCRDCHSVTDAATMHRNPAVHIGCADCHGGDPGVRAVGLAPKSAEYEQLKQAAHVLPKHPENWPTSANPKHSYANLLKESAEFVRFINPGDLRVAPETCGGCHQQITQAVPKSLMTTSAMLWGGASYNNNILPFKRYVLGESYDRDGGARSISESRSISEEDSRRGALPKLLPMPQWEVVSPGDIFRVFERGGLFIKSSFAEFANPNPFEDAGRPDIRASNRGPGTGARISVPVLNVYKTRLNDPHLSFMGTNDHPGDYRSSGCTGCHVIYANDRDPKHSGPYSAFGHEGKTQTKDPTISKDEEGHPLTHEFTRSIPSSQCMVCHMHQPNMFVNSYYGYTMWDYESDAPFMWPKEQKKLSIEEEYEARRHNPEGAVVRGLWSDIEFLKKVSELNPKLQNTQFADYHGHGWNFRAIFKKDAQGNLLDKNGEQVSWSDPEKFKKAVHLSDIHLDYGMHCADCHFGIDSHGNGTMVGEVAQGVEIGCEDCHGSVKSYATLKTSSPASPPGGSDLSLLRTPWGEPRFQWRAGSLYQRSGLHKDLEWRVKQVRDSVTPGNADYNDKAARAKMTKRLGDGVKLKTATLAEVDQAVSSSEVLAHGNERFACFTCHSSWVTSCAGCHLPIEANWRKESNHYDGKVTRNWATYNPQVARDEMFQIGFHGPAKDGKIVPVRSSSALVLSSTDSSRQKIYIQQPPTAASGHSSQAFAPHFPHTVRTTETKGCVDCHLSSRNDNNALMAQLLLLGTNFVNFMGHYTYVATGAGGLEGVEVTEWEEPQAVIGSYLHRYAYPDSFTKHLDRGMELETSHHHAAEGGEVNTIQLRGEYLFTAAGTGGFRVYDVASIANKGFSERIVTAPVSPLGQDTHVPSKDATGFALPTNMPVAPFRKQLPENLEEPLHPIYHYAFISDREEGLIVVNVDTLQDGDPTNNFLRRSATWNQDGVLTGARSIQLAGARAFVSTEHALRIVNLEDPLNPSLISSAEFEQPSSVAVQFRYAFVTDRRGLHVLDITDITAPSKVAFVPLADARSVYVARTYAYVAGGSEGLVVVDVTRPEHPSIAIKWNDGGVVNDLNDVKVASTNASLFGYLADGKNGLVVVQLTAPDTVPGYYGFSPVVKPTTIARRKTHSPARAITKPLDRDRAVDETGNQVSIFGRIGSHPFKLADMERLYKTKDGRVWSVD